VTGDDRVQGYARAVLSVIESEGRLGTVDDELFTFVKALEQHPELDRSLTDAALPTENKMAVIRELLADRSDPLTVSLLGFLVDAGRARDISNIIERVAALASQERQQVLAEVRFAVEPSAEQRERVAAALSRATGRQVDVKVVIDPSVVGGVVARVGDEVFDGSLATRLSDAGRHLGSV
jgi:F-type H+-transporting ATPase subunit delta